MRHRLVTVLVPLLLFALGAVGTATAAPPQDRFVDVVVVLDAGSDAAAEAATAAREHGARIGYVYETALRGFSARVPVARVDALARNPRVASVELDRIMTVATQAIPTGIARIGADTNPAIGIDGTDDTRVDVDVAVVDTGVDFEHPDLNVVGGADCTVSSSGGPPWRRSYYCSETEGTGGDDDHYHGTHVAGTIGALDNGIGVVGVAPGARLWAVKVLDASGSGYTSGIVAGIEWAVAQGVDVINMSLGGSGACSQGSAYDTAIDNAVAAGVAVVVAAGNDGANAANYSPASCDNAYTVSALADFDGAPDSLGSPTCRTDEDDTLANFSNFGSAVDMIAPGVCILSTYPLEQGEYASISGTSMAAPHVAGAVALLASSNPAAGADGVANLYESLEGAASTNWDNSDDGDTTKEPLLDVSDSVVFTPATTTGGGSGGGGGGGEEPPVSIDLTASGYKVKGVQHADLTWSGATSTAVDVYRDGALIATTADDGAYTDKINRKGGGSYDYQVCEAGTSTCSAVVTVVF